MRTRRKATINIVLVAIAIFVGLFFCFAPFSVGNNRTFLGFARGIRLGADLKGGVQVTFNAAPGEDTAPERMNATVDRLRSLLADNHFSEAVVRREGTDGIRIEVADVESPEKLFDLIGRPADLKFSLMESDGTTLIQDLTMTGKNVKNAQLDYAENQYGVVITFDSEGAKEFARVSTDYKDKGRIRIVDASASSEGRELTNANLAAAITNGITRITGNFTRDAADVLAKRIFAGAFSVKLVQGTTLIMSPALGDGALRGSVIAGIIILIGIMIYLCAIYRGMGVVASIALLIYVILFIILLWSFPWVQLSLPGIAGIILSIGMAVDANVVIFERIKEEYRSGKSVSASIQTGFKKSLWTVLDANITTILAAIVLIILGSGSVRGFGITLLMGILLSLLTAVLISRGLFKIMLGFTKYNNKFYALSRDANVAEILDEEPKSKEEEGEGAIPFGELMRREALQKNGGEQE